jgi:hypothetical protein
LALLAHDLKAGVETRKTEAELDEGFCLDVAHRLINISEN